MQLLKKCIRLKIEIKKYIINKYICIYLKIISFIYLWDIFRK